MIEVRGVHRVEATEPVYLIDVAIMGAFGEVDWESIVRPDPTQPRENWQSVYDEQELGSLPDGRMRAAFFFHYLDLNRSLESAHGALLLPSPSPRPRDLAAIEYVQPC